MGMHVRISTSTSVLWTVVLALQYVSPQQAPAAGIPRLDPAEAPVNSDGSSYQNSVMQIFALQTSNFGEFGLPNKVLFGNVTIR